MCTSMCLPASDAFTSTCMVVCLKTCHFLSESTLNLYFSLGLASTALTSPVQAFPQPKGSSKTQRMH